MFLNPELNRALNVVRVTRSGFKPITIFPKDPEDPSKLPSPAEVEKKARDSSDAYISQADSDIKKLDRVIQHGATTPPVHLNT